MISIKSEREIELLAIAGNVVYQTHKYLKPFIKPGITTKELDKLAEEFIRSQGCTPSFLGYEGFPNTLCTSINSEVVHGIPSNYKLKNGDIISIDIGACFKGYHGDSAWTYAVGNISDDAKYIMEHTEKSLYVGLKEIKPGKRIGDIGAAIEEYAHAHNLGVVKELVGHGVGTTVHEEPDVPNFGTKGTGPVLRKGMVIAVEPMLTLGSPEIVILDNDWTIETEDYSLSAHFEHTVAVTDDGYRILTGELKGGLNGQK
ncbi:MAG: type I methionyl aminopeptidase [Bacilli bacterium]|nr:type I methionyl aminopeptidase [Bacilli bacterium]